MSSANLHDRESTLVPATAPQMSAQQTSRVLLGLGLASWMEFYTFDAVNLVLPDMAGSFGVSQDQASWILTSFSSALFLGVSLAIWLAGYINHLRYIVGSAVVFVVASLGCALAPNFEVMLLFRVILGFSGAGLAMWWRATIYLLIPRPQRSKSLMRISIILYLSTTVGLLFSGYVTDNFSWRLIFLPNVLFIGVAVWLLVRHFPDVPAPPDSRWKGVDKPGIAFLGIALVSIQIMLSRGEIDDWFGSSTIQALAWITAVALLLFIVWQINPRNELRLMRLDLIRDRHVIASIFLGIFAGIILSGSIYALPEFLRHADPRELNATRTGQIMCAYSLTAALIRPLVTKSIGKYGQRKALIFSLTMLVVSMLMMARLITPGTPEWMYAVPLVLYAFCLAPLLSAVGGGTVARLGQEVQLDAVAIYMTFRQFGASLGVTLVSLVLDRREDLHSGRLFEHLRASSSQLQHWTGIVAHTVIERGGLSTVRAQEIANRLLAETGARQAAALAYADAFTFMAAIGVVALCLVPIMAPTPVVKK